MIFIEDKEKTILPKKYHRINNLCAIVYDQLTEIFKHENYKDLKSWTITFDYEKQILIPEFRKGEIHAFEWLKANELNDELVVLLTKNLSLAIISDFVNFMYESLSNAKRGKFTVAYALLRKPLTDELLILEQLLYDPKEFIQRFYHSGDPNDYDPSHKDLDKKKIIKNALTLTKPNLAFNEDLIYDLRYNKESTNGINGITNHALHIVTRDKNYKTENQNLNFVFSNEEDFIEYWDHYYYFVPYLLLYSVSVIDNLIFRYLPDNANTDLKYVKTFRRLVGTLIWSDTTRQDLKKATKKMYKAFELSIKIYCKKCKKEMSFKKPEFILFFETEYLICPSCYRNLLVNTESISSIKTLMDEMAGDNSEE